ncbi:MAG TPA: hypothetical protein VFG03_13930 [Telluria sp.]|nr:hypothetical protein [Telluria sp.]
MRHFLIAALAAGAMLAPAQAADLREFKGDFQLADGRTLSIVGNALQLAALLGDQPAVALVAAGPAEFVSRDGALRLRFTQHANGLVSAVTVVAPPPPRRE